MESAADKLDRLKVDLETVRRDKAECAASSNRFDRKLVADYEQAEVGVLAHIAQLEAQLKRAADNSCVAPS